MATKNIVPRTGSQGQLGTDAKPWKHHIADSGSFELISGSLTPDAADTYDLGTASKFWRDLYVSSGSIKFIDPSNNKVITTLGLDSDGNQKISGSFLPDADNTYDLGSSGKEWKDLYIDGTANIDSLTLSSGATVTAVLDEDAMGSDSATSLATQQSIKKYVDDTVTAEDLDVSSDSGTIAIDLDSETFTIAGGTGITTSATSNTLTITSAITAGDGLTLNTADIDIDAAQTTITSILATDLKIGEDDQTKIDFETADEIHFYANNTEQVYVGDNIFGPQSDSDVDLGSTGVRWKDAYVDSITVTGEVDGASLDISGNADIDGTLEADAITVDSVALNEYIADTVGAMVSSNTETNITVTYEDSDNTLDFVIGTLNQDTTGTADNITVSANNSTDETVYPLFVDGATGSQGAETDTGLTYNPSSGELTSTSGSFSRVELGDGEILSLGDGNDLQIYHGGSNSVIQDAGTGGLIIRGSEIKMIGNNTSDEFIVATENGSVDIYYDDSKKLETTSAGVTVTGTLAATSLDISGDVDVDGTLEADAYTVDGTTLAEYISDTAGGMVTGNTESGITVTYQDGDNTIDFSVDAAQTGITSLLATDIKIGEDDQTKIDFETANTINFYADNEKQLILEDGALYPGSDNIIDLGKSDNEFKDAFFDGTVTSDAFAGPLTGDVTGNADTSTKIASITNSNIVQLTASQTLTNKSIDLDANTLSGTVAEFNTALQSDSFATLANSVTLTNKTLTTPTIASFANANHDHSNSAGGGQITLGTGTTGNYVSTAVAGTGISVSGATGDVTISSAITAGDGLTLNTADIDIDAAQTTITSIYNSSLAIGYGSSHANIDFGTDNAIIFDIDGTQQLKLTDGVLAPITDNDIDLGTSTLEFKDAFFDGTVTSDAFVGPLTGDVTGNADTATLATTVTVSDSTANTNFPIAFHDESNALLDDTGTFTYNPSTSTLVVPNINVSGTQTFVNTASLVVTSSVIFEGATDDGFETTLTVTDPTADRTWTLQNATDTVVGRATTDTLTNKTLTSPDINTPDIDGGTIDGATIATSDITVGAGKTLDVSAGTLTLANDQISGDKINGGTIGSVTISQLAGALDANNQNITNINVDSGAIDAVTLGTNSAITEAQIDDININGNTIKDFKIASGSAVSTGSFGAIVIDEIIGNWTNEGNTVADLGTVTTVDINGGTIDGATIATSNITVGADKTLDVSSGTLTTSAAQKVAIIGGGDTDDLSEGSSNLYYTDARVKTKLTAEAVVSGSATDVRTFLNVDVSGTDNSTLNGLTATEIGKAIVTGSDAAAVRSTIGLGNVENTTLSTYTGNGGALDNQYIANGAGYITSFTNTVDMGDGFKVRDDDDDDVTLTENTYIKFLSATGTAGTNLAGSGTTGDPYVMTITSPDTNTDLSTNVTLTGSLDYLTISGQEITRNAIDLTTDVTGVLPSANLDSDTAHLSGTQTFSGAKTFSSLASFTMDGNTITGVDDSGEFTDDDAHIMTSAGVADKIESYGYLTNAGVTSIVAGTGIDVSGATGAVTVSTEQDIDTGADVQFNDFRADSIGVGMAATSTTGQLDAAADVIAYSSSDKRWKENLIRISDPLEKIGKISGYEFDWKELTEEERKTQHSQTGHDIGVIAQEIQEVLPEVVKERDNGYLAVKYEKIVPLLIESIKELKSEIEDLKKKN
jgi:hypothetical protein